MSDKTDQIKGRAKEAAGKLTDDKNLEHEGKVDRVAGETKEKLGARQGQGRRRGGQGEGQAPPLIPRSPGRRPTATPRRCRSDSRHRPAKHRTRTPSLPSGSCARPGPAPVRRAGFSTADHRGRERPTSGKDASHDRARHHP